MSQESDADLLARLQLEPVDEATAKTVLQKAIADVPERKRRIGGAFVILELSTLKIAAAAVSDLGVPALLVWVFLIFETRLRKRNTVAVSNRMLEGWSVDLRVKYKALKRFEKAGLISVKRNGNRSPVVTINTVP